MLAIRTRPYEKITRQVSGCFMSILLLKHTLFYILLPCGGIILAKLLNSRLYNPLIINMDLI